LIVGNCSEPVLLFVFEFVKSILDNEYEEIYLPKDEDLVIKIKKTKPRKRMIAFSIV
jgi:hypothetical protein